MRFMIIIRKYSIYLHFTYILFRYQKENIESEILREFNM